MEIGFQRGVSRALKVIESTTRRIEGAGGKMYSFCAMYSLRMSFWIVPEMCFRFVPLFSAATRYMAQIIAAGEFMVIEFETISRGSPARCVSMSVIEDTDTPQLPTSPFARG